MKRLAKSVFGVTLLEVMLVLAIAAMIIVMSIRYYQTASSNQQANSFLAQSQAIVTAAEQMAQSTGSYANAVSGSPISTANLAALLPDNAFVAPWGGAISFGTVAASSFTVTTASMPASVCPLVRAKLAANNHYTTLSACGTTAAAFSFTYVANP